MKKIYFFILFGFFGISTLTFAGASQASFTPTGYKYPIMKISIAQEGGVGEQVLYKCSGTTSAECMVNVADQAALDAIATAAANATIEAATYTTVSLYTCPDGSSGSDFTTISVSGTVAAYDAATGFGVASGPFSTSATAAGGMAAGSTAEFTDIQWACSIKSITMTTPFVVAADTTQTLTLLVDLTYSLWTDSNASAGMGGCKSDSGALQDVCGAMPFIIPYFGSGVPTYERYLIAHNTGTAVAADANAAVNLAIDENGKVFYAGGQPYFSAGSASASDPANGGPDYNASTRTLSTNTDGSIAFQTGGSSSDNRVGFTAFQRSTHTGTCKNELSTSPTWNYLATRQ